MRKLLLAGAAMLSGTVGLASVASAQLMMTTNTGQPGVASAPMAINGNYGSASTDIPSFGPPLSPGTYTVRLGGRLVSYIGVGADSGQSPGYLNVTHTSAGTAPNTKLTNYGIGEYARLYPSVDGMAANGLKYGAFLEIRADTNSAPGGGVNGSISSTSATRGEMSYRRETVYLGTDQAGFVRIGSTDQPSSLFATGTFENFDDGGWNSNIYEVFPATSGAAPSYPGPDVSALYTPNKIVYLSPKFANLVDFGVSFAPDTGNTSPGVGSCSYANTAAGGTGCDLTSSTSVAAETKRLRNMLDAVVRFRTASGPIGIATTFGGMYAGHVAYDGTEGPAEVAQYNNFAVFDWGGQLTYGGFAIGGHVDYGQFNNGWAPQPDGARDGFAWIAGTSYQFGPAIVGVQYFQSQTAGSSNSTNATGSTGVGRTFNQSGLDVGGTLTLAPGLYAYLSYLYGNKHQSGVDLLTGTAGTTATGPVVSHNYTQANVLYTGIRVSW